MTRLWEDGEVLVILVEPDTRDLCIASNPDTFFTTDHYRGYPAVLVHLSRVEREDLYDLLEESWRRSAPKRLLTAYEIK